ncbi:serine/threonine-protein kinase [Planctomicrobium sp. SH664]|uniref:serine/threonine-protein kinase n=1 Tax=Planctomicrobium sp. SH664 TaxID=3448125 RepID=UPI003F5BE7FC
MADSDPNHTDTNSPDQTRPMPAFDSGSLRQVGSELGDFRLLRRLGRGGMAEVWLAEQLNLRRNVALKLLRPELMEDENYVMRFQTEAKAAAGLNHPNIVQVYTVGCEKGQHFIAQEYVQGQTLKALLQRRGPLDLPLALMIMRQVGAALQTAGERGIVHRDIKPENIMLNRKGEVKVADFGLAQLQGGDRLNLTQEGVTMGTPLYMSPEQVSGKKLDQRSDIYSFGVTCYHMLAGRPPFEGDNAVSVAVKHLHENPPPLLDFRPDLPPAVSTLIQRMIAKNPDDRYENAQSIVTDVRKLAKAIRTGEPMEEFLTTGELPTTTFPVQRPALVLPLLCLLVLLLSAGTGWALRPTLPAPLPEGNRTTPEATARDQYVKAMLRVDDEAAFKAVSEHFPGSSDALWHRRAEEQLALLYLKDPNRIDEARAQLEKLETAVVPGDPVLRVEARVGQAYLKARSKDFKGAERILNAESQDLDKLTGSWRQLEEEVREMIKSSAS